MSKKKLHDEILELMKQKSTEEYEYINPNFLSGITTLIYDYYQLEDDEVNNWVDGMWSA